ncbi:MULTISPECIES: MFS transporter [Paraburkholderia]|uniref:MFS transporter n=1 Tax=Paraburkholderia TaxID=1822464 RepID=UPI0008413CED|nr:MFS transporter [Paraburkholderia nodosa]
MTSTRTQSIVRTISVAVVFTLFVAVVFGFGLYLFVLVVPVMRQSLGIDYTAIGIVTGGTQTAYLVAALVSPRLTTRFGEGQVIVGAVTAAALLLLLFAKVQSVMSVGLVLAGLGATAAFMMVPSVGAISGTVPFGYRSRVNGLVSSGTAYGQFANGLLVSRGLPAHSWHSIWIVAGSVSLVIALVGLLALRRFAPQVFSRKAPKRAVSRRASGGRWQLMTRTNLTVWILLALSGMACGPWQNYLSSFLADEGHSLATIGQVWSTIGAVGLFSGFAAGMAADKAGARIALAFSFTALAGSGLLIAFHSEAWQLRAAAVCFGLSFYAIYGLIPAYISKTMDPCSATTVFGVANVFLGLGTTLGNVMGGNFVAWFGSLKDVFITASAIACVAMILTATLRDERAVTS